MTLELVEKREVAEGTTAFLWEKPEGLTYIAGQTGDFTLVGPREADAEGPMRTFSLASAPHEPHLMIATRMRETAFKRALRDMPVGGAIDFDGPIGSFSLHENTKRPAVFLAGGIGITPFRSMVADAAERVLPHKISLFYSNRRPEDSVFLDDLQGFAKKNENFKLVATMTDMEKSKEPWAGERVYISAEMLARHLPQKGSPIYYIAGPQAMVTAMRALLKEMKVSNDDIRFEEFTGYS